MCCCEALFGAAPGETRIIGPSHNCPSRPAIGSVGVTAPAAVLATRLRLDAITAAQSPAPHAPSCSRHPSRPSCCRALRRRAAAAARSASRTTGAAEAGYRPRQKPRGRRPPARHLERAAARRRDGRTVLNRPSATCPRVPSPRSGSCAAPSVGDATSSCGVSPATACWAARAPSRTPFCCPAPERRLLLLLPRAETRSIATMQGFPA